MQEHIDSLISRCSSITEALLGSDMKDLPAQQQGIVKNTTKYGFLDNKKGMRYTQEWIFECFLLSIRVRKLYLHLKNRNILPIPTLTTRRQYLKNLKARYGGSHIFSSSFIQLFNRKNFY